MGLFKKKTSNINAVCPYYSNNKCVAGGQVNSCSANPKSFDNCFVYKVNATGDVSVLYNSNTRIIK